LRMSACSHYQLTLQSTLHQRWVTFVSVPGILASSSRSFGRNANVMTRHSWMQRRMHNLKDNRLSRPPAKLADDETESY